MKTINISLPENLYNETKKLVKGRGYSSISELMRDALRHILYPHLTENGFTPEFEDMVLESAKEPIDESDVWESGEDIDKYFDNLRKRITKHDKSDSDRRIQPRG